MDRIEHYTASDGRLYVISFSARHYVVRFGGDIFTVGQQPASIPGVWDDATSHDFAVRDIELRIRSSA